MRRSVRQFGRTAGAAPVISPIHERLSTVTIVVLLLAGAAVPLGRGVAGRAGLALAPRRSGRRRSRLLG